jgi:hypothetical protein
VTCEQIKLALIIREKCVQTYKISEFPDGPLATMAATAGQGGTPRELGGLGLWFSESSVKSGSKKKERRH